MLRQRIVTSAVALTLGLSVSLAGMAAAPQPASAQEPNASQICRALAEESPALFEELYGTQANAFGKCVSSDRTSSHLPVLCKFIEEQSPVFFEERYGNRGQCVKVFNEILK